MLLMLLLLLLIALLIASWLALLMFLRIDHSLHTAFDVDIRKWGPCPHGASRATGRSAARGERGRGRGRGRQRQFGLRGGDREVQVALNHQDLVHAARVDHVRNERDRSGCGDRLHHGPRRPCCGPIRADLVRAFHFLKFVRLGREDAQANRRVQDREVEYLLKARCRERRRRLVVKLERHQ